jgi:hypothetical protein
MGENKCTVKKYIKHYGLQNHYRHVNYTNHLTGNQTPAVCNVGKDNQLNTFREHDDASIYKPYEAAMKAVENKTVYYKEIILFWSEIREGFTAILQNWSQIRSFHRLESI